ncbi:class I SAM-dependent methyltransferase [Rhizomonospora bruguierae]|uniref:class I SAM-dependent methyltransferase n=1 Tax=Rhizomonospora bruguierae TaxID=1581705 RepID=UPI0020BE947D|nr:class I SAM-dependent methyltransferase [Micromonospora sp. NBRC 107566]
MSVDVAAYWDGQAAGFDAEPDHGLADPTVRAAWTRLLLPLMPTACARVADLGSGTGSLAVLLAQAGHRVSGVDLAPRMVEVARAKAAAAGVPAEFDVGDAATPPWPAGTFDVVLVRHVLWALPDPDAALQRWVELLKPDGRLVLVEGRWWTGGGLAAGQATDLVLRHRREAVVARLDDPTLWGGPIRDERYLLVSRA